MSKAFTNEDLREPDEADKLPERPTSPLPITARGRDALMLELEQLKHDGRALGRRARLLQQTLATVLVRAPALQSGGVGFGCVVEVESDAGGRRTYEIVGPDEADALSGRVSVTSPLARALLGKQPGDDVIWRKPKGDEALTIRAVRAVPP
ncbi:MAG TPA: GreA/GreB family elongation factor [Myxococcota bacterium]